MFLIGSNLFCDFSGNEIKYIFVWHASTANLLPQKLFSFFWLNDYVKTSSLKWINAYESLTFNFFLSMPSYFTMVWWNVFQIIEQLKLFGHQLVCLPYVWRVYGGCARMYLLFVRQKVQLHLQAVKVVVEMNTAYEQYGLRYDGSSLVQSLLSIFTVHLWKGCEPAPAHEWDGYI